MSSKEFPTLSLERPAEDDRELDPGQLGYATSFQLVEFAQRADGYDKPDAVALWNRLYEFAGNQINNPYKEGLPRGYVHVIVGKQVFKLELFKIPDQSEADTEDENSRPWDWRRQDSLLNLDTYDLLTREGGPLARHAYRGIGEKYKQLGRDFIEDCQAPTSVNN